MATRYVLVGLETTRSTQDEARRRLDREPVLVVAGRQTRGRGRHGRAWRTAPRALAASLALRPGWPAETWGRIPLVAGLAARRTLEAGVGLAWPNDLVAEGRKVGGILVEGNPGPPSPLAGWGSGGGIPSTGVVVIGLGVNLWWPDPPEGWGALHGDDPGPEEAVRLASGWAEDLLDRLERSPGAWGRAEYRRACVTLGTEIRWRPHGGGRAVDVDETGGLVVETGRGRRVLVSEEVREVRPT